MDIKEISERYRMTCDLHSHTVHSKGYGYKHGKGTITENARAAEALGIYEIAITDHGPGHKFYGLDLREIPEMRAEIEEAAKSCPVKINLGVEANIIDTPNGLDVKPDEMGLFDFIIAGYHYGLPRGHMIANQICSKIGYPSGSKERLRNKNTDMTLRALYENDVKIITHPCDKGPFDVRAISKACEETDTLMEINTRHTHLTVPEIKIAAEYDVQFIIDCDAHKPCEIGRFEKGLMRAFEAGLDISRIVNIEERK